MLNRYSENIALSSGKLKDEREYWTKKLSPFVDMTGFPSDNKLNSASCRYISYKVSFPLDLFQHIDRICKSSDQGMYTYLLTGIVYMLNRYTGTGSISIGMPHFKSATSNDHLLTLIKIDIEEQNTFKDLLLDVAQTVQDAQKYKSIQFHTMFRMLNRHPEIPIPTFKTCVSMNTLHENYHVENKEIDMHIHFIKTSTSLTLELTYNSAFFSGNYIEEIFLHLVRILEDTVQNPNIPLNDIRMLTDKEYKQIVLDFNDTASSYQRDTTIHQLVDIQGKKNAKQVAIIFKEQEITYEQLLHCSDRLTRILKDKGIKRGSVVAVMMDRSHELIYALIAVLKSGGTYVPIDPDFPPSRIQYMLEDSGASLLLTQSSMVGRVDFMGDFFMVDEMELFSETNSHSTMENVNLPTDPAYLIYTSGSTGKPKGVLISHQSVVNFFHGMAEHIEFRQGKTIAALTTVSFDIFVLEALLPLTKGMKIAIAEQGLLQDPTRIKKWLGDHHVQMLQVTPSRIQLLMNDRSGTDGPDSITEIMVGGEALSEGLLHQLKLNFPNANIFNMYGPTETTVWSSVKDVTNVQQVNLGKPIANTRFYIVDHQIRLMPIGVAGELCIAGDGVSLGYWKKNELNKEKFVKSTFADGDIIYRTGDLARWLPNGELEYLGRTDHQLKIRGYRVELGEIENSLTMYQPIESAVCAVKADPQGNDLICAYYTSNTPLSAEDIRGFLSSKLPEYMLPSFYIRLSNFPYTPNGKVDRKQLPDPYLSTRELQPIVLPANETEEKLLLIWKHVLEVEHIGVTDDFFNMGGHSLKALKLEVELERAGFPVKGEEIYRYPTVRGFAARSKEDHVGQPEEHAVLPENALLLTDEQGVTILNDENIEPFNEIFYKECLYNSLIPIVRYYGKNELPILLNDMIQYRFIEEKKQFKVEYVPHKPLRQVLDKIGIHIESKAYSRDIVAEIKHSIRSGKPVIVRIDCFYSSIRLDTYRKKHWPHTLLVFGFDDRVEQFYIVEHDNYENLNYQKRFISYGDLTACYEGYITRYKDNQDTYYEFQAIHSKSNSFSISNIEQMMLSIRDHRQHIFESIEHLKSFAKTITAAITDTELIEIYSTDLLEVFSQIINSKLVEQYRFEQIFIDKEDGFKKLITESIRLWKGIRANIAKAAFSGVLSDKSLTQIRSDLKSMLSIESQLGDKLTSFPNQYLIDINNSN